MRPWECGTPCNWGRLVRRVMLVAVGVGHALQLGSPRVPGEAVRRPRCIDSEAIRCTANFFKKVLAQSDGVP